MAETPYVSIDYFINNSFLGKPEKNGFPGLFRPSRFAIAFVLPNPTGTRIFSSARDVVAKYLADNIESIDLPSFEVPSSPTPFRHDIKQRSEEGTVTAVFYESAIMSIRNSMWEWINFISDKRGDLDNITKNYFSDIAAPSLRIYPLTLEGKRAFRHAELIDVFPTSVSGGTMNIEAEQELGKTSVTFKFRYHKIQTNVNTGS